MVNNYLVEHSVGSIIRGAFRIYFQHFGTLFLIFVLPVVPVAVLQGEAQVIAQGTSNKGMLLFSMLLTMVVSLFAYAATTVAVSDICVGNPPSFRRSYGKVMGKLVLMLLGTNLLQVLIIIIGFVLLIIPGAVATIWLLLTQAVVVLEGKSGVDALKRSKQLGDGAHWRNAGLFLLLMLVMSVIGGIIGGIFGAIFPHLLEHWTFRVLIAIVQQGLATPVALIAFVLIYYDRRVRKEGYDAKALAEDLAR